MFLGIFVAKAQSEEITDRREGHRQHRELRKEFHKSFIRGSKGAIRAAERNAHGT